MFFRPIADASLAQNAYFIGCQRTGEAIVVDPERDVDRYLELAAEQGFRLTAVAETHIHADYLSGARELVERHGAVAYVSAEGGVDWQFEWGLGHPRVRLLRGGDRFAVGNIALRAVHSPGHTPEHLSFLVTDHGGGAEEPMGLLSGDFIFVGDVGRPDLLESAAGLAGAMEPSARALWASLRATAGWPEHLQIWPAHGAGSACGKELGAVPSSVLGYERRYNRALREALEGPLEAFVEHILAGQPEPPRYFARMKRDNRLGPALLPGGRLPRPHRLAPEALAAWHPGSGPEVLLDLRAERALFMERHLPGALFAPLAGGKLPLVAGSYVDEGSSLILLVNHEAEVEEAVRQLVRIGLDQVVGWILVDQALAAQREGVDLAVSQARITTAELGVALEAQPGAVVLDVRGGEEFRASHVLGAYHIPYTRLAARLDEVPEGELLYVHCGSGLRASLAAAYLAREGREVVHVEGAFAAIPAELLA